MGQVTFTGRCSGDNECFCWDDIPEKDMRDILGEARYEEDVSEENEFRKEMHRVAPKKSIYKPVKSLHRLLPNDVIWACGVPLLSDKQYKFTLIVEEI